MKAVGVIISLLVVAAAAVYGLAWFHIIPLNLPGIKRSTVKPAAATAPSVIITPDAPPSRPPARRPMRPAARDAEAGVQDAAAIARLTAIYEQMPAEDAARILSKLPDKLVEQILRKMDERQAGKLLLSFPTERSVKLTSALARPAKNN